MFDWIKKMILDKYAGSLIRHALGLLSGFLLAIGIQPEVVESFESSAAIVLTALVTYAIAQLWSLKEKKGREE